MGIASFMLLFLIATMFFYNRRRIYKKKRSERRNIRQRRYEIRNSLLGKVARSTECLNVDQRYDLFKQFIFGVDKIYQMLSVYT